MARKPMHKALENTRLLKEYASWIYCTGCEKTVAYLCYVTYDLFEMTYTCQCGSCGSVRIEFEHAPPTKSAKPLCTIKNRRCCPEDESPLLTIVEKNVKSARFRIVCHTCHMEYTETEGGIEDGI